MVEDWPNAPTLAEHIETSGAQKHDATLALCRRFADLVSADVERQELEQAAETYERQVSEAVAENEETQAYVEGLERRRDALGDELDLPSGDTLAAELTRFLREHERRREEGEEA